MNSDKNMIEKVNLNQKIVKIDRKRSNFIDFFDINGLFQAFN